MKHLHMLTSSQPLLAPLLALPLLTGCYSPLEEADDIITPAKNTTLHVTTRSVVGDISYPVRVLAYDETGDLQGEQLLASSADAVSMKLGEGRYHITALSGHGSYTEPKAYERQAETIAMPTGGYASQPLMMGSADVLLGSGNASVSLVLSYRVAGLSISLAGVPSSVTAVSIGVSQQYGAIDMSGSLSGTSAATVACTKQSGVWTSGQVYVMPGAGSTTTLTLSLTNASQQESYNYQLSESLQAGVPYKISATYVEAKAAPTITGVITSEGWQAERDISFNFGSGVTGGVTPEVPSVTVTSLPTACSIWDGHVVALVDNTTSTEADLLLLSLADKDGIYAPEVPNHETDMADYTNAYGENNLTGWSIPTEAQARALRTAYAGAYDNLNAKIDQLGGTLIEVYSTSSNARYLCEEGTKTFNWAEKGQITAAGTSLKYRVRLVKMVHARVK